MACTRACLRLAAKKNGRSHHRHPTVALPGRQTPAAGLPRRRPGTAGGYNLARAASLGRLMIHEIVTQQLMGRLDIAGPPGFLYQLEL
jgi:hypothetical protein